MIDVKPGPTLSVKKVAQNMELEIVSAVGHFRWTDSKNVKVSHFVEDQQSLHQEKHVAVAKVAEIHFDKTATSCLVKVFGKKNYGKAELFAANLSSAMDIPVRLDLTSEKQLFICTRKKIGSLLRLRLPSWRFRITLYRLTLHKAISAIPLAEFFYLQKGASGVLALVKPS